MGDITVMILSIGMIIICWTIVRINDKVDRHIRRFKKFEQALKKNSTGNIPIAQQKAEPGKTDIPVAATSADGRTQGVHFVAKK